MRTHWSSNLEFVYKVESSWSNISNIENNDVFNCVDKQKIGMERRYSQEERSKDTNFFLKLFTIDLKERFQLLALTSLLHIINFNF